jgi:hypothetical protein
VELREALAESVIQRSLPFKSCSSRIGNSPLLAIGASQRLPSGVAAPSDSAADWKAEHGKRICTSKQKGKSTLIGHWPFALGLGVKTFLSEVGVLRHAFLRWLSTPAQLWFPRDQLLRLEGSRQSPAAMQKASDEGGTYLLSHIFEKLQQCWCERHQTQAETVRSRFCRRQTIAILVGLLLLDIVGDWQHI